MLGDRSMSRNARHSKFSDDLRALAGLIDHLPCTVYSSPNDEGRTLIHVSEGTATLTSHAIEKFAAGATMLEECVYAEDRATVLAARLNLKRRAQTKLSA